MRIQLTLRSRLVSQIALIFVFGLLLGIAILLLKPFIFLAVLGGIVYVVIVVKWPDIAILGILLLTSTIIEIFNLPPIPIGIGNLSTVDFLVIIPLVIILVRALVDRGFKLVYTPLNFLLLGFYFIAILSTIIGLRQNTLQFKAAIDEIRIVNLYLVFFIVTNLVRDEKRLRRLLKGILFFSFVVSVAMAIQYVLGDTVPILPGRVESVGVTSNQPATITRVLPPGQTLVMIGFVTLVIQIIIDINTPITLGKFIQLFALGFAVLLTFNRSFWVSIGLALFLLFCFSKLSGQIRFINILMVTVLAAVILVPGLSMLIPQFNAFFDASLVRMGTVINPDTVNEPSLMYRSFENAYALPMIAAHPFIGLGLGAGYRPLDKRLDFKTTVDVDGRIYIHNGHYWLMLKTGLIGYSFFMLCIVFFLVRSFLYWRKIPDLFMRGVVLAFAVTMCGLLVSATVNPYFRNNYWAPVFGIMFATVEVVLSNNKNQPQVLTS